MDKTRRFGSCCKDLGKAIDDPPNSFFRIEENGVLFLTVGYVETEEQQAFFDQAVLYCPFCGIQLQTREEIKEKATR